MYLDSCIIVKLLSRESDSGFFSRELTGKGLSTSELALTEIQSALLAKEREGNLKAADRRRAWAQFEKWVEEEEIQLIQLDRRVLDKARQELERCHPDIPLRTLDSIHVASCDLSGDYPLVTTDGHMRAAAERLKIPIFPSALAGT